MAISYAASISRFITFIFLAALATPILFPVAAWSADGWPGFRGAGDSHATNQGLPWTWELRGSRSGNWTLRLPGYGQSSPIVWRDQIFVTAVSGEEKQNLHILAVSPTDGKIIWQRDPQGTQRVKDSDTVSRGAPTPVADQNRVYVVFESGDVFALTHDGELVWHRSFVSDFGEIKGPHGYASSPVLVDNLCILQVAHSGPSYIMALDTATGQVRWRTQHPSQTGWSTPALLRVGELAQVIISTSGSVRSLDAKTGQELWNVAEVSGNSTASPTIAGRYIVIGASSDPSGGPGRPASGQATKSAQSLDPMLASGGQARPPPAAPTGSMALELTLDGATSPPRIAWKSLKVSAGYASPLVLDGLAYFVNKVGVLKCVDLPSGEILWQHRLPGEVWASPVANQGHITLFCKSGQVVTLKGGRELVEVAESQVSTTDVVYGVAAIESAWIIRSGRSLMRVSGMPPTN